MPAIVRRLAPGSPRLDARAVRSRAERMLAAMNASQAELSVTLTNDARMEELNRVHRRKAKPTDVLAFPMDEMGPGPSGRIQLLGDVVISLDTAWRQARVHRHDLLDEVIHLLAHGLLHLFGHDHRTAAEEKSMNAAVARLIAAASHPGASRHSIRNRS